MLTAQVAFVCRQQTPPEQIENVSVLQSRLSVHGLPSAVGAHALPMHVPEQQSPPELHAPFAPMQHLLCAVHRPNCESQHSAADPQVSPGAPQQRLAPMQ